jgi:hypothetical protein
VLQHRARQPGPPQGDPAAGLARAAGAAVGERHHAGGRGAAGPSAPGQGVEQPGAVGERGAPAGPRGQCGVGDDHGLLEPGRRRDVRHRPGRVGDGDPVDDGDLLRRQRRDVPVHPRRDPPAAVAVARHLHPVGPEVPEGQAVQRGRRGVADDPAGPQVGQGRPHQPDVAVLRPVVVRRRTGAVGARPDRGEQAGPERAPQVGVGPPPGEQVGALVQVHGTSVPPPSRPGDPRPRSCGRPHHAGDDSPVAHLLAGRTRPDVRNSRGGARVRPRAGGAGRRAPS